MTLKEPLSSCCTLSLHAHGSRARSQ